jgi:hypothetical protein
MKLPEHIREYFRKQGRIGARKRAQSLTPEQRREIAQKAANSRWAARRANVDAEIGTRGGLNRNN